MSGPDPKLDQIQRWMQSVIMHPGGVAEGVDSAEARQHVDITLGELESVIRRSRSLAADERLEIYVNAYHMRLMECLDEEFAVTRYALGEDLFAAVTFGYLQRYPSESYTLGELGVRLPRYLAETRLHASGAPEDAGPTWPDFIIELATLERSLYEVYDGPGTERGGSLDPAALLAIGPDAWGEVRLTPAPCLRLHALGHDVSSFWGEAKDGSAPAAPRPERAWLAITRRDYVVERHALSEPQFVLLSALCEGEPLSVAIERALSKEADPAALLGQLGQWFAVWAAHGFFARAEVAS